MPGGDRLIQFLALVAVLLFVGRTRLWPRQARGTWGKWAKWGAIAAFSAAFLLALGRTFWWLFAALR